MATPLNARPAPRHRPEPRRRPDLRVVPPRRRLRAGPTVALGGLLAFLIALGLVVAQAMLVQGQQRLDDLDERLADAQRHERELRLQVAELEAPDRVVTVATEELGMVTPDTVTYLTTVTAPTAEEQ